MKAVLVLSVSTLLLGCGSVITGGAMVEAQHALSNKNYSEALENIDIAESFGNLSEANTAKLHYFRAQSLEGLGRLDEAAMGYRHVMAQHVHSLYAGLSQQRLDVLKPAPKD